MTARQISTRFAEWLLYNDIHFVCTLKNEYRIPDTVTHMASAKTTGVIPVRAPFPLNMGLAKTGM